MGVPEADGAAITPSYVHPLGPDDADPANLAHDLAGCERSPGASGTGASPDPGAAARSDGSGPPEAQLATWSPIVAAWLGPHFDGIFQAWWARNKHRAGSGDPEYHELRAIATRPAATRAGGAQERTAVSRPLREWLASVGGPEDLTAAEADDWSRVWKGLTANRIAARIPRDQVGPDVRREPLARHHRAGRAVHRRRRAAPFLTLPDGERLLTNRQKGEALVSTRLHIWFTGPPSGVPPRWYSLVADAYMAGRAHSVPQRPPLDLKQLRGGVLAPGGSGVGADGRPYEVYHLHPPTGSLLDCAGFLCG